jgi:hypothetical protein
MTEHTPEMPPIKIAFVIDGQVVDVLHTDSRLASIFLSNPVIVDVTEFLTSNEYYRMMGAGYDGVNFTEGPEPEPAPVQPEPPVTA